MNKVAVITRTKDRSIFLRRAIHSVASQSYQDYVHVIVNDGGSKGEVEAVIDSFDLEVKSKIRLFHRELSSNAPDTIFNESINRAESEYFAIHDDDDTWHPDFLQETVGCLDTRPDTGAVVVKTDKVIEEVNSQAIVLKRQRPYMLEMDAISLYRQCIDNQLTPISTLFRRKAYEKVGGFDDSLPVVGDWEFGIRLLQAYEVCFLNHPEALAYYHHRKTRDNSFSKHNHRKHVTQVANKYLREELKRGELGVGYIMSKLKFEQDVRHSLVKKFIPKGLIKKYRQR